MQASLQAPSKHQENNCTEEFLQLLRMFKIH